MQGHKLLATVTLYLCGVLQGFVMVGIPASSLFFKQGLGITDDQYSQLFLPQLVMAIVGAFLGGWLYKRIGLPRLLTLGVLCNTLAQLFLYAASQSSAALVFWVLMAAAASIGLGFGLCSAPLSTLPTFLFPQRAASAMVALHTIVGIGFTLGPQFVSILVQAQHWPYFPLSIAGFGLCLLLSLLLLCQFPQGHQSEQAASMSACVSENSAPWRHPLFAIGLSLAILYAFCESTLSNWAVIFLNEEKQLSIADASLALSGFWAGLTLGRLTVSALLTRFSATQVWQILPALMLLPFFLLNTIHGPMVGIAVFTLGGFACSGFFPLTIRVLSEVFPDYAEQMAAYVTAALMVGIGLGSYVIAPLRQLYTLPVVYQASVLYPLFMLFIVIFAVQRYVTRRNTAAQKSLN